MRNYVATTLAMFLRKIAIDYMRHGYMRYALRHLPEGKDVEAIDRKLLAHYGVSRCRTTRMRQRRKGQAVVQYVRYKNSFVLLATEGRHPQFDRIISFDARSAPLHLEHYAIGMLGGTICISLRKRAWEALQKRLLRDALHPRDVITQKIMELPYCNFPGVLRQKQALIAELNQRRKKAGLHPIHS